MILRVRKRAGKEKEDVLKAAGEAASEREEYEEVGRGACDLVPWLTREKLCICWDQLLPVA